MRQNCLRSSRIGAFLLILAGLALAPHPASGEDQTTWDQERVTQLAVDLAVTMRGLRREMRRSPPADRSAMQVNRRHRFMDHLRLLQNETRFLAAE